MANKKYLVVVDLETDSVEALCRHVNNFVDSVDKMLKSRESAEVLQQIGYGDYIPFSGTVDAEDTFGYIGIKVKEQVPTEVH